MPIATEAVRQIPIFALLGPEDLALVAGMLVERHYDRGAIIVLEGTPRDALFYLRSGLVNVFTTSPMGKEQALQLVYPGQTFNDVTAFGAGTSPASAEALEESVVYAISRAELLRLVPERPEVAVAAIQALALLLRFMIGRVEDLAFHHVRARVARILLEQDDAVRAGRVTHRLTHQEIAAGRRPCPGIRAPPACSRRRTRWPSPARRRVPACMAQHQAEGPVRPHAARRRPPVPVRRAS